MLLKYGSAAVRGPGLDADLAAADPEQGVARIALLEQRLTGREVLGVAKARYPRQFVGAEIGEHRIHLQNDGKFGRFAHCNAFLRAPLEPEPAQNRQIGSSSKSVACEVCHKSHNFAAPPDYFCRL